jgi:hypothetical protein
LEHEVLSGHERDRRGARVGFVGAASRVAVGRGYPSSLEVAATPAGGRPLRGCCHVSSSGNAGARRSPPQTLAAHPCERVPNLKREACSHAGAAVKRRA